MKRRKLKKLLALGILALSPFALFLSPFSLPDQAFQSDGYYYDLNRSVAEHFDGKTYVVYEKSTRPHKKDPHIMMFNHAQNKWDGPIRVGSNDLAADDTHGVPNMAVDKQGFIHVVWNNAIHGGSGTRHARSRKAGSITDGFERLDAVPSGASYRSLFRMKNGNVLYVYKHMNKASPWYRYWGISISIDNAFSFGSSEWFIRYTGDEQVAYAVSQVIGNELHVVYHYSEHAGLDRKNAYYIRRTANGVWKNAAGTVLNVPLSKAESDKYTLVYNSGENRSGNGDTIMAGNGKPYVYFSEHISDTVIKRFVAHWDGNGWKRVLVTTARNSGMAGSLRSIDSNTIELLLRADNDHLERWRSTDGGKYWSKVGSVYRKTVDNPQIVRNGTRDAWLYFYTPEEKLHLYGDSGFIGPNGLTD